MSDGNGNGRDVPAPIPQAPGIAEIRIRVDLGTGKMQTNHPPDLLLTMQILADAIKSIAQRTAQIAAAAAPSAPKIQIAGGALLDRIKPPQPPPTHP